MVVYIKSFYLKYQEMILYVVFGIGTFLVDTGVFWILGSIFSLDNNPVLMHTCSVFATTLAIIFAYVTNRKYVFKSETSGFKNVLKEVTEFFAARIFTLIMAELMLQYGVTRFRFDSRIVKIFVNVIVIILNYIFSKLWIFKK